MMINYRQISVNDAEYPLEKALRNEILRLPLGLQLSNEDIQGEDKQLHLVAVNSQHNVVGCVLIICEQAQAKIRQMAVAETYQRLGIGTKLVQNAERIIQSHKIKHIVLHARLCALGFYEHLGYVQTSAVFTEVSIDHVKMEKKLPF